MSRLGACFFCAALVVGATVASCGGGGDDGGGSLVDIVGSVNVPGWTVDPSNSKTANVVAATATTEDDVVFLIDGAAAEFFADPFTPQNFAWQNYVHATLHPPIGASAAGLKLYILEMPDAGQAESLYAELLKGSLYAGNTWTDPTSPALGSKSRITDSGADWWINFVKGRYYVEVRMTPSYGPSPDYEPGNAATKEAALTFAATVAGKL